MFSSLRQRLLPAQEMFLARCVLFLPLLNNKAYCVQGHYETASIVHDFLSSEFIGDGEEKCSDFHCWSLWFIWNKKLLRMSVKTLQSSITYRPLVLLNCKFYFNSSAVVIAESWSSSIWFYISWWTTLLWHEIQNDKHT